MAVVWGLVAGFCWGLSVVFSRAPIRALGSQTVLVVDMLLGAVALSLLMLLSGEFTRLLAEPYLVGWALAILATTINGFANVMLYRAIEIGVLSTVTPISSTYAAFVVVIALVTGDSLTMPQIVGIVFSLIGIVLVMPRTMAPSTVDDVTLIRDPAMPDPTHHHARLGALLALGAALSYGVGFWILGFKVTPILGSVAPIWVGRFTSLGVALLIGLGDSPRITQIRAHGWHLWVLLIASIATGIFAYIANNSGYQTGEIAVVSVLASLYSPIAVFLAAIFFRERLQRLQWFGLGAIFAGVVLVSG